MVHGDVDSCADPTDDCHYHPTPPAPGKNDMGLIGVDVGLPLGTVRGHISASDGTGDTTTRQSVH